MLVSLHYLFQISYLITRFLSEEALSWSPMLSPGCPCWTHAVSVDSALQAQGLSCQAEPAVTFINLWVLSPLLILQEEYQFVANHSAQL